MCENVFLYGELTQAEGRRCFALGLPCVDSSFVPMCIQQARWQWKLDVDEWANSHHGLPELPKAMQILCPVSEFRLSFSTLSFISIISPSKQTLFISVLLSVGIPGLRSILLTASGLFYMHSLGFLLGRFLSLYSCHSPNKHTYRELRSPNFTADPPHSDLGKFAFHNFKIKRIKNCIFSKNKDK